jgi:hypothetical protein
MKCKCGIKIGLCGDCYYESLQGRGMKDITEMTPDEQAQYLEDLRRKLEEEE